MKKLLLLLTVLLVGLGAFGQDLSPAAKEKIMQLKGVGFCGTATPSAQEMEAMEQFIRAYQSNARNLRPSAETVYIPLKIHIVTNDAGELSLSFFKWKALNQSIATANAVFKKANIEFFITGTANIIKSTKLLNLVINSTDFILVDGVAENRLEEELCRSNDVPNTVNVYFVNNLTLNGLLAANYAKQPTLRLSSYRVMMNGLSIGGYGDLKSTVLAHELGHHFSLHHPFDAVGGKELVTRGPGFNCDKAGDLVCDTPADPFNDIPENSPDRLLCGDLPPNYKDANGEIYKPDLTNVMTYYSRFCKGGFTPGQYQRVLAGLALRKTNTQFGKYDAPDMLVAPPTITAINNYEGGVMQLFIKDNSDNETGFIIERATSKDGEFVAIGGTDANITGFNDRATASNNYVRVQYFF